ncbi:DUF4407 domain-containing protein [Streptosporangium sp. NPDC051023]|uniref:DUF4407 domain-containing protein n=1 Tax=Streptosporangium sp. NPDC051023 TaxID=3155410 RepID=UPI00344E1A4A
MTEGAAHRGGRPRSRPAVRLDLGRRLRILAGADEGILDQVPLERTRYVGLGGVVLGTAVVAATSMWFALGQVLGGVHIAMVVPALIWLLIVLNLDRWLVSTVTGMWQRRLMMLIPRLLVAVVLGSIIAEPLVLRVFETAVVQHVIDEREDARTDKQALLKKCNPLTGAPPPGHRCEQADYLTSGAVVDEHRIADLKKDEARLQTQVDHEEEKYEGSLDLANDELFGNKVPGATSGKPGNGAIYRRDLKNANEAKKRWQASKRELDGVRRQISALGGPLASKREDFGKKIETEIDRKLATMPGKNDPVGILERMRALHELSSENTYLFAATWLFRLFLVLIDCLPVLVKLMGGTTAYDRMVEHATRMRERVHEKRLQLDADAKIGELELRAYDEAEDRRRRRQLIDIEGKAADAEARARREELMNQRAEELNRQSRGKGRINGNHPHVGMTGAFR